MWNGDVIIFLDEEDDINLVSLLFDFFLFISRQLPSQPYQTRNNPNLVVSQNNNLQTQRNNHVNKSYYAELQNDHHTGYSQVGMRGNNNMGKFNFSDSSAYQEIVNSCQQASSTHQYTRTQTNNNFQPSGVARHREYQNPTSAAGYSASNSQPPVPNSTYYQCPPNETQDSAMPGASCRPRNLGNIQAYNNATSLIENVQEHHSRMPQFPTTGQENFHNPPYSAGPRHMSRENTFNSEMTSRIYREPNADSRSAAAPHKVCLCGAGEVSIT